MADSKVNVLIHPVRLRIASLFRGRGLTTKEISEALPDIPQGSLYRHIKKMAEVGILQVVEERPLRGAVERVYQFNYKAALLNAEDLKSLGTESLKNYYLTLVMDLMREMNECIDMPGYKMETHGPKFLKVYRYASTQDRADMVKKILSSVNDASAAEPVDEKNRTLITFTIMSVPDENREA